MKVIILLVAKVLAVITANVAFLWAIIEFILYLVKDKDFNWWSVWAFIISVVVAIAVVVIAFIMKVKNRNSSVAYFEKRRDRMPKSKFQQRLDEMAQKRANT